MSIVYFDAYSSDERLFCKWVVDGEVRGCIVAVARNPEFTNTHRMFLLPSSESACELSVGPGAWYVRIGCFAPTEDAGGVIAWSGIQGPIHIASTLPVIGLRPPTYEISSQGTHADGHRVVLRDAPYELYYLIRRTDGNAHHWLYRYTPLHKFVDMPAPAQHVKYTFYLWTFPGFPTSSIEQLADGHAFRDIQAEPPVVLKSSHDRGTHHVDRVIINDAVVRPMKFSSHADYVRYHMALARTSRR